MIYNLDTKFNFGKFYNSSLKRVFVGNDKLSFKDKLIINEQLNRLYERNGNKVLEMKSLKINDDLPKIQLLNIEFSSFDWLIYESSSQKSYLEWCLNNINTFCINPKTIEELESLKCIFPTSISIKSITKTEFLSQELKYKFEIGNLVCDYKLQKFSNNFKKINLKRYHSQTSLSK